MTIRLRLARDSLDDMDTIAALHTLAFPDSPRIDLDGSHTFWLATCEGVPVGFCSAIFYDWKKCVFLSRAAVMQTAAKSGLQRRMIRTRVAWARTLVGCDRAVTYCAPRNYPSLVNLLRCGFRLYEPTAEGIAPYGVAGAHYFRLRFT